jgi:hypothetical protein
MDCIEGIDVDAGFADVPIAVPPAVEEHKAPKHHGHSFGY